MREIEIIIASSNKNKIREYNELFKEYPIIISSLEDENIELDVEETGTTFEENALIKARYISQKINKIVIADDSGLCIHALNDFPGIYSSRFMEGQSYILKNQAINEKMKDFDDKTAHFTCSIVFVSPKDNIEKVFVGRCYGKIVEAINGPHGFGYDPIFMPDNYSVPFSLLPDEEKNKISHRGLASKKLIKFLEEYLKNK